MNTADFETDAGRAAKVAEKRAKEIDATFRKVGVAIGLALGAAALGATAAIKRTIDGMDEMSKAAQKLQMPTEDFSRLAYAGELADVSIDALVSSLGILTKTQAAALSGTSRQAKAFDELEIAFKRADGSLRSASDVMADFADKFVQLDGSPEAMAAGFTLFGRSFQELIPLLKDGSQGLRDAAAESDALGKTLSTQAGLAAEDFNDNLNRMQSSIEGIWQEIGSQLLPQLVELTNNMLAFVKQGDNAKQIADGIAGAFSGITSAATTLANGFGIVEDRIAGVQEMIIAVRESLSGLYGMDLRKLAGAANRFEQGMAQVAKAGNFDPKRGRDFQTARGSSYRLFEDVVGGSDIVPGGPPRKSSTGRTGVRGGGGSKRERLDFAADDAEALKRLVEATSLAQSQFASLAATLDGPLAEAELGHTQRMAELLDVGTRAGATAAEIGRLRELEVKRYDQEAEAIARRLDPGKQLLEDLKFEAELLGMTNAQREAAIQMRGWDAESVTKYAQDVVAANQLIIDTQREMDQFNEIQGALEGNMENLFSDIISGSKSAKDAFKDFAASVLADIARIIAKRLVESMLNTQGSAGAGASGGGGWAGLFASFASSYKGGFAAGGTIPRNSWARVNENGPEMLSVSGRDYLMTGGEPVRITPNNQIGRRAGAQLHQTNNLVIQGVATRRTQERAAQLMGREAQRALARTGR